MINVQLVTNDGNGLPQNLRAADGTTVSQFLAVNFDGDTGDFSTQVRNEGESSYPADGGSVLQNNCRITLSPRKVEGASS